MIKGVQPVTVADIQSALVEVLAPKLTLLLQERGPGHCMRVSDLDSGLMLQLCETLKQAAPNALVVVLDHEKKNGLYVTSTKLVELRNPDENGDLRAPLLVFVPNELKTSSEDSFGVATFEQVDVSYAYRQVFDLVRAQCQNGIGELIDEIRYLLNEKAALVISDYQWARYLLVIKTNDFDSSIVGAALYELGLIPDLELHQDKSLLANRLMRNVEAVSLIRESDKSPVASVYELQLEGDHFNKQLALFLNSCDSLATNHWLKQLVLDSSNWPLTFDKWRFQYEQQVSDSVYITVTDLELPVIQESEQNPALQQLIGLPVLTVGSGGLRKFSVKFTVDPKPSDVSGLAKFKAQVYTQQGDFSGLIKAAKKSSRASVSISFNRLSGIDWDEGWHYVRLQAFDENDELIPLVDESQNPIPWGTSKPEDAGSKPNESELFYVLPAADADVDPIDSRKPKEASLCHAQIRVGFDHLLNTGKVAKLEIVEKRWLDSKSRGEALIDVKFKKATGVQIPISLFLRNFEQKIVTYPMNVLTWRMDIRNGTINGGPVGDSVDWPIKDDSCFSAFREAREKFLSLIRQESGEYLSVVHDYSSSIHEAEQYAKTYLAYLNAVFQAVDKGQLNQNVLTPLLAVDSLNITIWNYDGSTKQALLLGPTHPLRAVWLSGWSGLGAFWLNQAAKTSKELVIGARNSLLDELSLTKFPYVLPIMNGQIVVVLESIHPFWAIYSSAQEKEPQALIDEVKSALAIKNDYQRVGKNSGEFLAAKVLRYLLQHPYVSTLVVNVFNAGAANTIADLLLRLKARRDLAHINFDIRLFVADPYASEAGSALFKLIDSGADDNGNAGQFVGGDGQLLPLLSISLRSIDEFNVTPWEFSAHLSLLFDVFPAEEISVAQPAVDERVAPVHGLYQDYCVDYFDGNGVVAWDRHTRHGLAKPLFGGAISDLLSSIPRTMAAMTAAVATGKYSLDQVPVIRLSLNGAERDLLNTLHEISDWVFTVDRNLGIEYFDHGGKDGRPDYLIDHSPEMVASNSHSFVITSRSTMEVEALLKDTLEQHQISPDSDKAIRVLDALRALSGRLALKLASNSASKSEALGLALAKLYLEYQGVFQDQIVVPLDAHLELYSDLKKTADELGDTLSLKRTDLALFDLDEESRTLRCNLIEVKCYSDVGEIGKFEALKKQVAEQISESERVLQRHFDSARTTPDRPDRLLKTQQLCTLLEHYLKRSERLGILRPDVVDEARYFLRTMEQGYKLVFSRNAIIFDFSHGRSDVENEIGIEFHRIGKEYIDDLLSIPLLASDEEEDYEEQTLASVELTLPKLSRAGFLHKERDRTVTWIEFEKQQNAEAVESESGGIEASHDDSVPENDSENLNKNGLNEQHHKHEVKGKSVHESGSHHENIDHPEALVESEADDKVDFVHSTSEQAESRAADIIPEYKVAYDVVLGVNGDSEQFGILGEVAGRKVALDLNHTHTISLFGVQGGGKSYTLGTVIEMATAQIPAISQLKKPLATVIFHYSPTQDYKPEFTSMIVANNEKKQLQMLQDRYGAEPTRLSDVVLLTPVDKLEKRIKEYPGIDVYPLRFSASELQAGHWKFLMGAVGNQAAYIRQMTNIMRQNRHDLTLEGLRQGVENSRMSDAMKDLAMMRLDFAGQYIDDTIGISNLIRPGRMIIVDLRDEFIEKDEALGLFVVLLQIFSEVKYQDESFNKLIVFDECHKYIESPDLVKGLIEVVREMRHKGTSILVASQDPPSVPVELIELSSQIILHKFNSPAWLKHIQKANSALSQLTPQKMANLQPGEAYIWSSKASDTEFTRQAIKIRCRPRVTLHGGDTKTAI